MEVVAVDEGHNRCYSCGGEVVVGCEVGCFAYSCVELLRVGL